MLDHGDGLATGRLEATAPTLVRLTTLRPKAAVGEPVSFLAQVVNVHRDDEVPTGMVAFRAGHRLLGTAPLDEDGLASLDDVRLPTGVHVLVASYGGDASHAAAASAPVPHAVAAAARRVLVAVQAPGRYPGRVVLRAELLDPRTGRLVDAASGTITFTLDGTVLGAAPLLAGEATLELPALEPGRLTARYGGDLEHAAGDGEAPAEAGQG